MDDELLKEFINECREHLDTIETDLLTIEEGGAEIDLDLVNKVFRAAHSIKGGSSFFGLTNVMELAHKAETILDMLRSKKMAPNVEITNVLLAAFDKLREMINNTSESDKTDNSLLITSLTELAASYLPQNQKASLTNRVSLQSREDEKEVSVPQFDFERARRTGQYIYTIDYDLIHDIEKQGKTILDVFRDLMVTGEILDCSLDFDAVGTLDGPISNSLPLRLVFATIVDPNIIGALFPVDRKKIDILFDPYAGEAGVKPAPVDEPYKSKAADPELPATAAAPELPPMDEPLHRPPAESLVQSAGQAVTTADETLRVNVGLLEKLMNLTGELVLSRNQLHTSVAQNNQSSLINASQRINQVTTELQEAVMQTRLQPIGNVFSKFPRVVRDLSSSLHKDMQVDIRGKDVALDRSLLEGLSDPLTHMVRNAADHGIEAPAERIRKGKKGTGTIIIEARHEAGQVVVEVSDDGKGIDPERVARAAIEKGLIPAEKVRGMSDSDKISLIFLPGLSTSEKVSDTSGRGVGMDVVKTNLDRLGGKVEVKSEINKGTMFRIKLPLTLAIIPALIVGVESERFAIPQINVEELLRIRPEDVKRRIEVVGGSDVLLLRDKIIPLIRLDSLLHLTSTYKNPLTGEREIDRRTQLADRRSPRHELLNDAGFQAELDQVGGGEQDHANKRLSDGRRSNIQDTLEIAVLTTGTMQYGLVVGSFHDNEEIVVKPLGHHLKTIHEYAGATILGDGRVCLIIDVAGLAVEAELTSVFGSARARELAQEIERERLEDNHALLLFFNTPGEYCAMPLDSVLRVERITPAQVETAGGLRTMQYRGASLPLVTLSDIAKVKTLEGVKDLVVIVSSIYGREVGLLGSMPVDVVETKTNIDVVTHRQRGIAGSSIIHEHTTLIVDLFELVEDVYPDWVKERTEVQVNVEKGSPTHVLLAEDSDFFRNQVKRFLEEDGYTVLAAPDGEDAWVLLTENLDKINLVVTDVEMPRLTGLELAQRIRGDDRTSFLPVIALTSLAGEDDMAKGKAAGINDYQIKLDRDRLLLSVHAFLDKV